MFFDTAVPYQINLQDSATYGMEMIVQLHNYVMFINVFIISVVIWFFFEIIAVTGFIQWFFYRISFTNTSKICLSQLIFKQIRNAMLHMSTLEVIWTLLPVLALITIALPSLSMLYYFSLSFSPAVVVNVIGHQWFWSYEYNYTSEQYIYEPCLNYTFLLPEITDELIETFCNNYYYSRSDLPLIYSHAYDTDFSPFLHSLLLSKFLDFETLPWTDEFPLLNIFSEVTCAFYLEPTLYTDNQSIWLLNLDLMTYASDIFFEFYYPSGFSEVLPISLDVAYFPNDFSPISFSVFTDLNILDFSQRDLEKFDSIMVQVEDLNYGSYRLLEVDKPLYLPVDVPIRIIVSSDDVLHSWAVPSLGVKIDCVPGRLNVVEFRIARTGVFYGQCSEICGTQHGFMPICIVAVPRKLYNFI